MTKKIIKAKEGFSCGYNCCQAVVSAFDEIENVDLLLRSASSFGGGIGGKRQVCGAVSGMCIVLGAIKGYDSTEKGAIKKAHTELISKMCDDFIDVTGSMVCGELLGMPEFKTLEHKNKLPCIELVALATEIAAKSLK